MLLCILPTYFFSKESKNNNHFFQKKNIQKVIQLWSYFFLFNTDKTQTFIFRMFYMLIEYFMLLFMIPVDSWNMSTVLDYFSLRKSEENEKFVSYLY